MGALDAVMPTWMQPELSLDTPEVSRYDLSWYLQMLINSQMQGGIAPVTTYGKNPAEPIGHSFDGYVNGLLFSNGPVAAAEAYRLRVFGQAPPLFQRREDGRAGDLYDDESLDLLRHPWTGGTGSDLMKRALLYSDFGGNGYVIPIDGELVVPRPDWVEIILAERLHEGVQVGWRQVGIAYSEGGVGVGTPAYFLRGEYAHFVSYMPDPLASWRGMSWLTPIIREIQSDKSATDHKLAFFENAATPNLAVSLPKEITPAQFSAFVDKMDAGHKGAANAYKTLYTGGGADVTVIGADMRQMDLGNVQGKIETRVANASGVSPVLLSFSEGMQGSSLNAGNYTPAKRNFVDTTMRDLWQNWYGSLEVLFPPRGTDRLWYDARDIPFLHEDQKDAATIQQIKASTISSYVTNGYTPDSAVASVDADDRKLLVHSGLVSVQLLPPGQSSKPLTGGGAAPKADAARAAIARKYDPEQPRIPAGHEGGGRWGGLSEALSHFLQAIGDALGGQEALDATPARLHRAPGGHHGHYEGEALSGPAGMGSVRALSEYEGPEYQRTNDALRYGFQDHASSKFVAGNAQLLEDLNQRDVDTRHRIAEIDKTMAVSRLTSDVKVDRVIRHGAKVFGEDAWYGDVVDMHEPNFDIQDAQFARWEAGARPDLTGLRFTDPGYVSTTADPKVALNFGKRWLEFNSPLEGEPVAMRILVPKGTGGVQLAEMGHAAEILLERGLTFEVVADHGVDDTGYRRLDVMVVRT